MRSGRSQTTTIMLERYRILYHLVIQEKTNQDNLVLKKSIRRLADFYNNLPRVSRDGYLVNLLEVAIIMAKYFYINLEAIIAILLQDAIKDRKITEQELRKEFGNYITAIVLILTNFKNKFIQPESMQQSLLNFQNVLYSFSENNLIVVLIKIAEYLHSMHRLDDVSPSIQSKVIDEIKHFYIPFVHRLGLGEVQLELEDLQIKFQNKTIYNTIAHKIRTEKATKDGFFNRFVAPIHTGLQKEIKHYSIKARTKNIASIWHKMESRNIAFEDIHDFYAIRIVFDSELSKEHSNCWLIYELLTTLYEPRLDRLRDWLSYPRDSGYEALHITVMSTEGQWVEVQIRTKRMDQKAEYGNAAHWKYKYYASFQGLAKIPEAWFQQAQILLHAKQHESQAMVSIKVDPLYIQPK
jgi:guanosine-3',5'-bis(diphosphate) 3'-pyrophosphohydrolase